MEAEGNKKRILIVDDEEKFCKVVKKNLEKTGNYEVRFETKGKSAFEAAKEFRPHLIMLDVLMPDMRGPEVAFQIQEDQKLGRIPILFVTATIKKGLSKGFGGLVGGRPFTIEPVVSKPINTKDLVAAIDREIAKAAGAF